MHDQLQFIDCLTDLVQRRETGLLIVDEQFGVVAIAQYAVHLGQLLALPESVIKVVLLVNAASREQGVWIPKWSCSSLALEILVGAEHLLVLPALAIVALALTRVLGLATLDVSEFLIGFFGRFCFLFVLIWFGFLDGQGSPI